MRPVDFVLLAVVLSLVALVLFKLHAKKGGCADCHDGSCSGSCSSVDRMLDHANKKLKKHKL